MKKKYTKKPKYGNFKTIVDGIKFDSQLEANRYKILKAAQNQGLIKNLELQPKFLLQSGFYNKHPLKSYKHWEKMQPINYIADFRYTRREDATCIIEDTKGLATPEYKLKLKMFLSIINKYEGESVIFREVKSFKESI